MWQLVLAIGLLLGSLFLVLDVLVAIVRSPSGTWKTIAPVVPATQWWLSACCLRTSR